MPKTVTLRCSHEGVYTCHLGADPYPKGSLHYKSYIVPNDFNVKDPDDMDKLISLYVNGEASNEDNSIYVNKALKKQL